MQKFRSQDQANFNAIIKAHMADPDAPLLLEGATGLGKTRAYLSAVIQAAASGNGLAFRLTKPMVKEAGVVEGTQVRVTVIPGRILIDAKTEPTLEELLAAFIPEKHGGEFMAEGLISGETLA